MDGALGKQIIKIADGSAESAVDSIAVEKKLRISVNGKEAVGLYCSPLMVRELVVGFFMTEEIIKGNWCAEAMTIEYGEDITVDIPAEGQASLEGGIVTSGCVGGMTFPREKPAPLRDMFSIEANALREAFGQFQKMGALYRETGCVHSAALSDGKDILCHAEDIGRHNAVDKVIGHCIIEGISFEGKIMLASGRLSSEIVSKCARWKIPVVASRTAPTTLALEIAEQVGITVVGFIRGRRMNVYTSPERIIL